jgi:hypothetical protein
VKKIIENVNFNKNHSKITAMVEDAKNPLN